MPENGERQRGGRRRECFPHSHHPLSAHRGAFSLTHFQQQTHPNTMDPTKVDVAVEIHAVFSRSSAEFSEKVCVRRFSVLFYYGLVRLLSKILSRRRSLYCSARTRLKRFARTRNHVHHRWTSFRWAYC